MKNTMILYKLYSNAVLCVVIPECLQEFIKYKYITNNTNKITM